MAMELVTIKEISTFLNVKEPTLYSWVRNGSIPSYKVGGLVRFDMEEVRAWVGQSRATARNVTKNVRKSSGLDINNIIKKAVEGVTGKRYNPSKRETSLNQGLRKEVPDGTV